jgi:hypothetical protein
MRSARGDALGAVTARAIFPASMCNRAAQSAAVDREHGIAQCAAKPLAERKAAGQGGALTGPQRDGQGKPAAAARAVVNSSAAGRSVMSSAADRVELPAPGVVSESATADNSETSWRRAGPALPLPLLSG